MAGDARRRAPRARRRPAARRHRDRADAAGGGRPAGRQGSSTARGCSSRVGFVYDHAAPIGGVVTARPAQYTIDARRSAAAPRTPASPRRRGAAPSRRRRRAIAELRFGRHRRRDDRERRHHLRRRRAQHRRRPLRRRGRGARARHGALRSRRASVPARCARARPTPPRAAARDVGARGVPRVQVPPRRPGRAARLRQALEACGIAARAEEVGGGADAHIFNGHGIACVDAGNGMELIHTPGERIVAADVDRLSRRHGRARRRGARRSRNGGSGRSMKVGVVTEIKADEYRVALTPAGARELVARGPRGAGRGAAPAWARASPTTPTWRPARTLAPLRRRLGAQPSCC